MELKFEGIAKDNHEQALLDGLLNSRTGYLRSSRPPLDKKIKQNCETSMFGHIWVYADEAGQLKAEIAYVWRMLSFYLGTRPEMPVTAEYWLGGDKEEVAATMKRLDSLVDRILKNVPLSEQYGTVRWGKALGLL